MPTIANVPLLLKQLRLTSMGRHWEGLLQQSQDRGWDAGQYLAALCEQELADRHCDSKTPCKNSTNIVS